MVILCMTAIVVFYWSLKMEDNNLFEMIWNLIFLTQVEAFRDKMTCHQGPVSI